MLSFQITGKLQVPPTVELLDQGIVWNWDIEDRPDDGSGEGIMDAFSRLMYHPEIHGPAIRKFTKRFGPLRIGKQQSLTAWKMACLKGVRGEDVPARRFGPFEFSLDWWRAEAAELYALMQVSMALARNSHADRELWRTLRGWDREGFRASLRKHLKRQGPMPGGLPLSRGDAKEALRDRLEIALKAVMSDARLELVGGPPRLIVQPSDAGNLIRLKILESHVLGANLALCSHCGVLHERTRRPRAGENTFCPQHRARRSTHAMRKARDSRRS